MPYKPSPVQYACLLGAVVLIFCCLPSCEQRITSRGQAKPDTAQTRVGGPCDGCSIMYDGMPDSMDAADTSAAWFEPGTRLLVKGTVYQPDGKTPAAGVIVYYYHTDHSGHYSRRNDRRGAQTRHGYIRGWLKTGADGSYAIFSGRPAPYPHNNIEAHIHILVKEPQINEYYIDDLVFDDDPFLTADKRERLENRGGSGILEILSSKRMQTANHDIILGLNVPDYP